MGSNPGEIKREDVNRIQRDPKGKDNVVHVWSTNERLQGPVGTIFRVDQNLPDFPVQLPADPGGIRPLPDGSYIMKLTGNKETSHSTPEKRSYYDDVYLLVVNGREFPIDGGLTAAQQKVGGNFSSPTTAAPAPSGPTLSAKRLFRMSQLMLETYYDVNEMSLELINHHLLSVEGLDELHFWIDADYKVKVSGKSREERDGGHYGIKGVWETGYEMALFVMDYLGALDKIEDEVKRRKMLVFCLRTYIEKMWENRDHQAAVHDMMTAARPHLEKMGIKVQ